MWTLPFVKGTVISVEGWWFCMHVADAIGFLNYWYIAHVLEDGRIYLIGESTESCKSYEKFQYNRPVFRRNERKRYAEV